MSHKATRKDLEIDMMTKVLEEQYLPRIFKFLDNEQHDIGHVLHFMVAHVFVLDKKMKRRDLAMLLMRLADRIVDSELLTDGIDLRTLIKQIDGEGADVSRSTLE